MAALEVCLKTRKLAGRTVVVIGAGSGIGAATARALAPEGTRLVLGDIRDEAVRRTVATLGLDGRAIALVTDVSRPASLAALRDRAIQAFGQIDAVVNCAGVVVPGAADSLAVADIRRQIDTNLLGTVLVTRAFLPYFRRLGTGHLVHIGSLGGIVPMPLEATYSATKFAVRGFCLALALELHGTGIEVSVVCPDSTDTAQLSTEAAMRGSPLSFLSDPLDPADVARAIVTTLRRPRLEAAVPRGRGLPSKLLGWSPGILRFLYPVLEPWGTARRDRFAAATATTTPTAPPAPAAATP